jgi:hypothetical protein
MKSVWRAFFALTVWLCAALLGSRLGLPVKLQTAAKTGAEFTEPNRSAGDALGNANALAGRLVAVDPWSLNRLAASSAEVKPVAGASTEAAVWRLAALGRRGKDGFAVLTTSGQTPLRLVVGNTLPDGDKIKAIHVDHIQLLSPRGHTRTLYLIEP